MRLLKIFLYVFSALLVLILVALMFLGTIATSYVNKNGQELIGRKVSVKNIDVSLLRGLVKIEDLVVKEEDEKEDFVRLHHFYIDLIPVKLLNNNLSIDSLLIDGLYVNVEQNEKQFNFDDIIEHFASDTTQNEEVDTTAEPLKFHLKGFALRNSEIKYEDLKVGSELVLDDLDFDLPEFRWDERQTQAALSFTLNNGGLFEIDADYDKDKGDFDVALLIKNLVLDDLTPYLQKDLNISAFNGKTALDVKVKGNLEEIEKLDIQGNFKLIDFAIKDSYKDPLIATDTFTVSIKRLDLANNRFELGELKIDKPFIRFDVYADSTNSFSRLSKPKTQEENRDSIPANEKPTPIYFSINNFNINDLGFNYYDYSKSEKEYFKFEMDQFNTEAKNISSNDKRWTLPMNARLNKEGSLTSTLDFDPNNPLEMNLDLLIKNFQMEDINYYCHSSTGYAITKGDMTYKTDVHISDRKLKSKHDVEIHYMEMAPKDVDDPPVNLPIRTAVYLMKDEKETIKLKFPVKGDLDDPNFTFNNVLWKVLRNTVVKVTSSPFKMVASTVNTDPSLLKDISFEYADTSLSNQALKSLDALKEVRKKKPDLKIELIQYVDQKQESIYIAMQECKRDYLIKKQGYNKHNWEKEAKKLSEKDSAFIAYLEKKTKQDAQVISYNEICLNYISQEKANAKQAEFQNGRILAIKSYLRRKYPKIADDIVVRNGKSTNRRNIDSPPIFDIKYTVQDP